MSEFRMRSVVQGRARDPDPVRLPPVRVGAAAQPSSVIPGRPSAAEEDCAFSREEVEVHATYIRSGMSRDEGDHMLRWARNEAYRSRHIRFGSMRALCTAISKAYAPEGVSSVNFHEPQDGKQHVVLYHRSLLGSLKRVLANPRYAGILDRAGRAEQGPAGYRRRKVHTLCILHAHCAHLAHFFTWCARSLDGVHGVLKVLSKFVQSVQSSQKVCSTG